MSELSSDVNLVSIKARQDNVKPETKQQYKDMWAEIRFLAALNYWWENCSVGLRVSFLPLVKMIG